jgi:trk system potassium uptake protein
MLTTLSPVLSLMARILLAFSVTFLVPGIWAWFEDHRDLQWFWADGSEWLVVGRCHAAPPT